MILTPEQRMAAEMGLDVDNPFGRGASRGKQWPGGVMVYAIHPTLGTFLLHLKMFPMLMVHPFRIKVAGIYSNFHQKLILEEVNSFPYVAIVDKNLTWNDHLDDIRSKINSNLSFLRWINLFLTAAVFV